MRPEDGIPFHVPMVASSGYHCMSRGSSIRFFLICPCLPEVQSAWQNRRVPRNAHQLVPISKVPASLEMLLLPKLHPKPRHLPRYVHNNLLQAHAPHESCFPQFPEHQQAQDAGGIHPGSVSKP